MWSGLTGGRLLHGVLALALVTIAGCERLCTLEEVLHGLDVRIRPETYEPLQHGSYVVEGEDEQAHSLGCTVGEASTCDEPIVEDELLYYLGGGTDALSLSWVIWRGDIRGGPYHPTIRVFLDGELLVEEELEPEYQHYIRGGHPDCGGSADHAFVELLF